MLVVDDTLEHIGYIWLAGPYGYDGIEDGDEDRRNGG